MADSDQEMDYHARLRNSENVDKLFSELTEVEAKRLLKGATNIMALIGMYVDIPRLVMRNQPHEQEDRVKVVEFIQFMNKIESVVTY